MTIPEEWRVWRMVAVWWRLWHFIYESKFLHSGTQPLWCHCNCNFNNKLIFVYFILWLEKKKVYITRVDGINELSRPPHILQETHTPF